MDHFGKIHLFGIGVLKGLKALRVDCVDLVDHQDHGLFEALQFLDDAPLNLPNLGAGLHKPEHHIHLSDGAPGHL